MCLAMRPLLTMTVYSLLVATSEQHQSSVNGLVECVENFLKVSKSPAMSEEYLGRAREIRTVGKHL